MPHPWLHQGDQHAAPAVQVNTNSSSSSATISEAAVEMSPTPARRGQPLWRSLPKARQRDLQGNARQDGFTRRDPVLAVLIFLKLLEADPYPPGENGLGHPPLLPVAADICADHSVNGVGASHAALTNTLDRGLNTPARLVPRQKWRAKAISSGPHTFR